MSIEKLLNNYVMDISYCLESSLEDLNASTNGTPQFNTVGEAEEYIADIGTEIEKSKATRIRLLLRSNFSGEELNVLQVAIDHMVEHLKGSAKSLLAQNLKQAGLIPNQPARRLLTANQLKKWFADVE